MQAPLSQVCPRSHATQSVPQNSVLVSDLHGTVSAGSGVLQRWYPSLQVKSHLPSTQARVLLLCFAHCLQSVPQLSGSVFR